MVVVVEERCCIVWWWWWWRQIVNCGRVTAREAKGKEMSSLPSSYSDKNAKSLNWKPSNTQRSSRASSILQDIVIFPFYTVSYPV